MSKIDIATYMATIEVDSSGVKKGMQEANKDIDISLKDIAGNVKSTLGKLGIGAALGKLTKEGINSFATVEEEMNKVFTMLPGISGEAKDEMTKQARELSLEVGKLPEETIPAIYSALSAGVPKDNVFDYVEVASKMAVAGGAETEEAVEGLAAVINAYNMEATEAEDVSDMFFETLKRGMTSVPELSHSLSNVTPIASSLGVQFEEVAGAMATMTAQGIPTSTATNQLKAMLAELSKEGSVADETFSEIAGKSFPEFIESGGTLNEALRMMEEHAKESGVGLNNLFGSVNAGQGALALTGENMKSFTEDVEAMKNSAGATETAFEEMNQGINRFKEVLKVTIDYILYEVGEVLAPLVDTAFNFLSDGLENIIGMIELVKIVFGESSEETIEHMKNNEESLSSFEKKALELMDTQILAGVTILDVVEWIKDAYEHMKNTITNIIKNIVQRLYDFKDRNEETFKSIRDTIGKILERIQKIISSFVKLVKKVWGTFNKETETSSKVAWDSILSLIDQVLDIVLLVLDGFIALFSGDWEGLWKAVEGIASKAWDMVRYIVDKGLDVIISLLVNLGSTMLKTAKDLFWKIIEGAKYVMGELFKWLGRTVSKIFRPFTNSYREARNSGKGMFRAVWDGMKEIWSSIFRWVSDKVSWLADKLAFWRRGNKEMDDGGGSRRRKKTGSFATGTRFIKEDGLNLLHKGEAVIPAHLNPFNPRNVSKGGFFSPKFALAGGGGGSVVYDVDVNVNKADSGIDIKRAVEEGIKEAERKRNDDFKRRGF